VGSRLRLLFVDDEEELVSAVIERLQLRGIDGVGVTSGEEALRRLADGPFDIVVLDVKMPGLGGLEVLRRMKHHHPGVKVILLTGHGSVKDTELGLALGAVAYLQKPVDLDVLLDTVRSAVEEGGPSERP